MSEVEIGGNLHLYSDVEGSAPFTNATNIENFLHTENGVITGLKNEKDHLVFLGDVMDHGPHAIKTMQALIKLHSQGKATIILGNRDVNKLRFIDEFKLKNPFENIGQAIVQIHGGNAPDPEYSMELNDDEINYLFSSWTTNKNEFAPLKKPRSLSSMTMGEAEGAATRDRTKLLVPTFGAQLFVDVLLKEIEESGEIEQEVNKGNETHSRAYLMIQSIAKNDKQKKHLAVFVMGYLAGSYGIGDEGSLKGLYLRYLRCGKICDLKKVGETQCFLCHSGFPRKLYVKDVKTTFLTEYIQKINEKFTKFVNDIEDGRVMRDTLKTYIDMSGPPVEPHVSDSPIINDHLHFHFETGPKLQKFTDYKVDRYSNSTEQLDNSTEQLDNFDSTTGSKLIKYVVSGHKPQGPAPSVFFAENTVYACIDVSINKTETRKGHDKRPKGEYKTYAVMTIRQDGTFVINGRGVYNERYDVTDEHGDRSIEVQYCNESKEYETFKDSQLRYKFDDNDKRTRVFHSIADRPIFNSYEYIRTELPACEHLVMVVSNGAGPIDSDGMVREYLEKNPQLLDADSVMIGFDGDPPETPPAKLVAAFVKELVHKVVGIVQVQVNGFDDLPKRYKDYSFTTNDGKIVPLYTFVYINEKDRDKTVLEDSKYTDERVIDIDKAFGAKEGYWGGFDDQGNAQGSTAGWIKIFESAKFSPTKRHLAAFWDHSSFVQRNEIKQRKFEGSITESTIKHANNLGVDVENVTFVQRENDKFDTGGGGGGGSADEWAAIGGLVLVTIASSILGSCA